MNKIVADLLMKAGTAAGSALIDNLLEKRRKYVTEQERAEAISEEHERKARRAKMWNYDETNSEQG